jgi:Mg/Co/Ni transporter MgtE
MASREICEIARAMSEVCKSLVLSHRLFASKKARSSSKAQAQNEIKELSTKMAKSNKKRNEYIKEYNKENRVRISLNLSKTKDSDILQAISEENKTDNIQASIKSLIRRGI